MCPEAKAEALEHHLSDLLDERWAGSHRRRPKSRWSRRRPKPPSAAAPARCSRRRVRPDARKMPALAPMPDKPTLVDFFNLRFAPANHVLQSATRALKTGMTEEIDPRVPAARRRAEPDQGRSRLVGRADDRALRGREGRWAIHYHQALRFYPDPCRRLRVSGALRPDLRQGLRAAAVHQGRLRVREEAQVVHGSAPDHRQRPLRLRSERARCRSTRSSTSSAATSSSRRKGSASTTARPRTCGAR